MADDTVFHTQIEANSLADLRDFVEKNQPDLGCRAVVRRVAGRFMIHAYLPARQLAAARASEAASLVTIRVIENATDAGRRRQREVGVGNRYAKRNDTPHGLGRKE